MPAGDVALDDESVDAPVRLARERQGERGRGHDGQKMRAGEARGVAAAEGLGIKLGGVIVARQSARNVDLQSDRLAGRKPVERAGD